MRYSIRTVTPIGDIEPLIGLAEAKAHLRVDFDEDDALIAALVLAAQDHVERHTSQVLTPRNFEIGFGEFPCIAPYAFEIPREPITAIASIGYIGTDGVAAELLEADWRWVDYEAGLVRPAYSTSWPRAYAEAGSVRIGFEAGYEIGLAPASLVAAVKLLLGTLYGQREGVVTGISVAELPGGVMALCAPYRRILI